LKKEGLTVTDAVVFLDRQQGGQSNLENNGIKVHKVINVTELLQILFKAGRINQDQKEGVEDFLQESQIKIESKFTFPQKIFTI
jgi:uridine monophosphate synthetase